MEIYLKNEKRKSRDEIINQFINYIECINRGYLTKEYFGYDRDITYTKIHNLALFLAKNDGVPLLDKSFLSFLQNKNSYFVLTLSHPSFYLSFGYCYEVGYEVSYCYSEKVVSGYETTWNNLTDRYETTPIYSTKKYSDSYYRTIHHDAVGVLKVNNNGDLIKNCKNLECDNYKYWPTTPNSLDFFEGNFQRVTLEEIKNSTFYDNIRIPSNDEISCYIESYCDSPSMHSNIINSDKNELLYELSYDYTNKSCYRQNLIITKSHLIDTFKYIVENYYTYKLSYTYNGVKHEYSADNFAKTLKSLDDFHLIFSPEIEKYEKIAENQLERQANESKENIKLNKQKTNKLKAILDRRNKSHLITVCIIASLYVLSFVGSIIYPIIFKFTSDSFFFYPVSFYQLGIALFLVGLYLFYYFHKHKFNSYRSSRYKDWQGKIDIIPDYLIDDTRRNDTIFQVFLIIIYVFASIFLLYLIMCWLSILFIH